MASIEQKNLTDEMAAKAAAFLSERAEGFEEIRIAVAGFEGLRKTSPKFPEWTKVVLADRNPDGTFGKGPARGKATGERVAALLRMGADIEHRDTVVAAMKEGQRPDGGWSKDDGPSDLGTSYRVMRAFYMLKEAPDLAAIRKFIAGCRKPDGGYSATPDGAADPSGCYYATIILGWARTLAGEPPSAETAGFVPLFNGKDLDGWEGDTKLWSARDGMLVGTSPGLKHNDFLATARELWRLHPEAVVPARRRRGEQRRPVPQRAGPGPRDVGLSGRHRRGLLGLPVRRVEAQPGPGPGVSQGARGPEQDGVEPVRDPGHGRSDHAVAQRRHVGRVPRGRSRRSPASGKIAVQIHAGGPMEVQFKDILIQALPTPTDDVATSPGFHLRTVKTAQGDRKYTVYVPEGYDDKRAMPAVLFLHGSGERGEDGIQGAQIGLGAAIARHPEDFPMIAVFPQARKTWAADSDDAKAALAALDDVLASFKVDRKRVVLTGLSMGGAGAWEIAAAHPDRFAAVVPDLRSREARGRRDPEGPAPLDVRRRRGLGPDRAEYPGDGLGPASRRREAEIDRVPGRRPQQLGSRLQRPEPRRLDARPDRTAQP